MSNNHHAVILDSRTHRVIRLGENLSDTAGYHVSVARHEGADHLLVHGPTASHRIKVGNLIVPASGAGHETLTDPSHQFPVVLNADVHRIVPVGKELSGDSGHKVIYHHHAGTPNGKDELSITPAGGQEIKITPHGKIPPNTGA